MKKRFFIFAVEGTDINYNIQKANFYLTTTDGYISFDNIKFAIKEFCKNSKVKINPDKCMATSIFECDYGFEKDGSSPVNIEKHKCLILASYCDNEECSDEFPCPDCLQMCNVVEVDIIDDNIIGDFTLMKKEK